MLTVYKQVFPLIITGVLKLNKNGLYVRQLLWSLSFGLFHSRRPRGSQSGREKRRDESFQAQGEKPLGTDSHRAIFKRWSECWLLIGHKKCFVLLCAIGEQHLLSSFREFVHDGYWLDYGLSGSYTKEMNAVGKLSVWYKLSGIISEYCQPEN